MRRAQVVTVVTGLLLFGGAGVSSASSGQPVESASGMPRLVERATDLPEPMVTRPDRPRRPGSIPHVIPRGPRPVPMPELRRSGPRPVPMPHVESGRQPDRPGKVRAHRHDILGEPDDHLPEELRDGVDTILP